MRRSFLVLYFTGVIAVMFWATISASLDRNVLQAAVEIWNDPWGRATLLDTYFAFLTLYLFVFFRESSWTARLLWLAGFLLLGNFAIAASKPRSACASIWRAAEYVNCRAAARSVARRPSLYCVNG